MIRGELYEWVGVDRDGKTTTYQTHGPDVTEAAMLEHLQKHFPGLRITNISRVGVQQFKPQAEGKEVQSHAFMRGTRDAAVDALGSLPADERSTFLARMPGQCTSEWQVQAWLTAAELLRRRLANEQNQIRSATRSRLRPSVLRPSILAR